MASSRNTSHRCKLAGKADPRHRYVLVVPWMLDYVETHGDLP